MLCRVSFCFSSDNVDEVKAAVSANFGYDTSDVCVSGHLNIFNWKALLTILHMTLPVTPVYTAILILRRAIVAKISSEKTMSENSRRIHSQLLQALTYQACLPIFFLFAVITYAIGQLNIYHHPILEYSTFILVGFIPMLSPLTSFRFIRPYRVWINDKLLRRPTTLTPSETRASVNYARWPWFVLLFSWSVQILRATSLLYRI